MNVQRINFSRLHYPVEQTRHYVAQILLLLGMRLGHDV